MGNFIGFSIVLLFILGGCTNNGNLQSKCSVEDIEKNLSYGDKKRLYQNIQNEIRYIIDDANTYYAKTYYFQALENYELINFYHDGSYIPLETIEALKLRTDANGKYYYDKASKVFNTDKLKTLFYLNELMRNDPNYKDGKQLYLELREDSDIQKLLAKDKKILQHYLQKEIKSNEDVLELNNAIDKIARYDDLEPYVLQGRSLLKTKRYELHSQAIDLYNNNKLEQAKSQFTFIDRIYGDDRISKQYISLIDQNDKLKGMEQEAILALDSFDYKKAMNIANDILALNNNNSNALDILKKANIELRRQIPKMITKATGYYTKQEYQKALNLFQEVLKLEVENNTALTYSKKIRAQLRTIESLK